ncbi:dihydrolipoyl dehydrogenase [Aurantimonas manganoxydans SI85-9A1]|uniref:Dihydrolipoyl dehydrogenase n=1 Tax=Aurantimonas manganoxydans (strain ATCC BAA-1229 / DSM 21871 / SI85-9A1) TaxID=287752 RepID=Q1YFM5_AURMS|nr:dihydrolipoyl dehydrogenase [Aurantimonas manganoxydans]EAS48948.1 dihydrolipoyl dehydrogenase [Aurantimonas manganoxydans SI85-9A1]
MTDISCQLLVIGAGPGGYVAAIRAGQLGLDTVIVDDRKPGGTCLNIGCIPSKALIHAADEYFLLREAARGAAIPGITAAEPGLDWGEVVDWKDGIVNRLNNGVTGLLKRAKVKLVSGRARFLDGKTVEVTGETGTQRIAAENVVIATGSVPVELPSLPFGGKVISSAEALSLDAPPERLVVVGGGYIGVELGTAFAKAGSTVTIVEATAQILPLYDAELVRPVRARLEALGVEILTEAKAMGLAGEGGDLVVEGADGGERRLAADRVLVTVGRRPLTDGWGREELVLEMDGPFLRVDEQRRTAMRGVYAIGDVCGEPMLAHKAMAEGEMVAEIVAGARLAWDKRAIPAICFTDPEIVTVGLSPEEAKRQGHETKIGLFPFQANGRAMTLARDDGFVRVVARADNHLVLGIQAVGAGISELSAAFGLALEMGACLEDIAGTIHAHPTQGEGFQEAAFKALGHAIHI